MAVIDEIEALDISREFVVRQGVPEMCGAIGKGCLAVKGKQGRAVGAFEPAGRHQQFRQYIIRQPRKTLSHVQFHSQCCVILDSHLDSPRMAVKVPAAHQCLRQIGMGLQVSTRPGELSACCGPDRSLANAWQPRERHVFFANDVVLKKPGRSAPWPRQQRCAGYSNGLRPPARAAHRRPSGIRSQPHAHQCRY